MRFNEEKFNKSLEDALGDYYFVERPSFLYAFVDAVEFDDGERLGNYQIVKMGDFSVYLTTTYTEQKGFFAVMPNTADIVVNGFTSLREDALEMGKALFGSLRKFVDIPVSKELITAYDRARSKITTKIKAFIAGESHNNETLMGVVLDSVAPALGLEIVNTKSVSGPSNDIYMFVEVKKEGKTSLWLTFMSYGTCSWCDALIGALCYAEKDARIRAVKSICLNAVQNMKEIYG